jgi:hypothetical protein
MSDIRTFIIIPAAPACQAHGGGAGLALTMKAIVWQKLNKQFFWEDLLCYAVISLKDYREQSRRVRMKLRSGIIALATLLAVLVMAGCATTADKQARADHDALCSVLDTNKDGKITKEEFMAKTTDKAKGLEVFEKCDTDKKGHLTYDEVWQNRMLIPPSLIITTPPLVRPVR